MQSHRVILLYINVGFGRCCWQIKQRKVLDKAMIELTLDQQKVIDASQEEPLQVVDPRTQTAYFLIRSEEYERLQSILDEEARQRAINRIARRNAIRYAEEDV